MLALQLAIVASLVGAAPSTVRASLYAVTDAGVAFESTNDGVTWTAKGQIPEPNVVSLSPGLTVGRLYALGESGSLYKTSDAGAMWSGVGNAGASDCVSLAIARGGDLIALTRSGSVIRTANEGASWSATSNVGASDCVALAIGGKADAVDTLFAVTSSGDVSVLPTGASWTNVGTTGDTPIVDLLWMTKTLYALTDAGEILKSSDNGATWSAIATISQVGMRDLAFVGGKFKAISKEGEVYESATASSWSSLWIGTTNQVFTVAFAPGVPEFQTGVDGPGPSAPTLALRAWPNPFVDRVEFRLDGVAAANGGTIEVFDAAGRRVGQAVAVSAGPAGTLIASWDGRRAPPGVYFAQVRAGSNQETIHIVHLR